MAAEEQVPERGSLGPGDSPRKLLGPGDLPARPSPHEMQPMTNRVAVIETILHQLAGEQPTSIENRFARELETDEQSYDRKVKIGENWTLLDLGWVANVGGPSIIVIVNEEGRNLQVNPSEEERKAIDAKVIELCSGRCEDLEPEWFIPPGESFRGSPLKPVYLRCRQGIAKVRLFIIPR